MAVDRGACQARSGGRMRSACLSGFLAFLLLGSPAFAANIDWVTVGNPGNAADVDTGLGAVDYVYRISRYEVTNAQYAEFLNAVAATDTHGLYNPDMALGGDHAGGILRLGSSGGFVYEAIAGRASMPVNYVSVWDAMRFANWLHNGQPSGAQDSTTTEEGSYTITASGIAFNTITRNAGATIVLPSEDEWYKAAYHDALGVQAIDYFDYPGGTDVPTICAAPSATPNTANCLGEVGDVTDVGSYPGAASPYGTFDQAGNVIEWLDTIPNDEARGLRGGGWEYVAGVNAADHESAAVTTVEHSGLGFRVATTVVPEPSTALLVGGGLLMLCGLRRLPS